jgi:hypothetical protein
LAAVGGSQKVELELNIQQESQAVNSRSGEGLAVPPGNAGNGVSGGFFYDQAVAAVGFNSFSDGGPVTASAGASEDLSAAPTEAVYRVGHGGPLSMGHTVGSNEINSLRRRFSVWNGLIELKSKPKAADWKESGVSGSSAKRGVITRRSQKSRVRQLKYFGKLPALPEMFSTLTIPDDVMAGMNQGEKVAEINRCKRSLSLWLRIACGDKPYKFVWSQEWKKRKSGELKGELVPHLHGLWMISGASEAEYYDLALKLSSEWVRITGTEKVGDALKILGKPESHQYLGGSKKMTIAYCTKYTVKQGSDKGEPGQSIGRTWGSWGPIEETEPETLEVTDEEVKLIKRGLRRKYKHKAKGFYLSSLKIQEMGTMALLTGSEMVRWIETLRIMTRGPGVPF